MWVPHIELYVLLILNIFAEAQSQYITALLKHSTYIEPLPMSLEFDDKVKFP